MAKFPVVFSSEGSGNRDDIDIICRPKLYVNEALYIVTVRTGYPTKLLRMRATQLLVYFWLGFDVTRN